MNDLTAYCAFISSTLASVERQTALTTKRLANAIAMLDCLEMSKNSDANDSEWRKTAKLNILALSKLYDTNEKRILSDLCIRLEDLYNLDLGDYLKDEADLLYTIEANTELRERFDVLVEELLPVDDYFFCEPSQRRPTIFDTPEIPEFDLSDLEF